MAIMRDVPSYILIFLNIFLCLVERVPFVAVLLSLEILFDIFWRYQQKIH